MTTEALAILVIEACESEGVEHMITGAFATNLYGIPRSTKDVDVVLGLTGSNPLERVARRLTPTVTFEPQVEFDTLTWGKRLVGTVMEGSPIKIELFELFDDPFVTLQFARRKKVLSKQLDRSTWVPAAEDLIVQKLRWGRSKDLDDARDVLAVQGVGMLDMSYVSEWCATHGTTVRLEKVLAEIAPLG